MTEILLNDSCGPIDCHYLLLQISYQIKSQIVVNYSNLVFSEVIKMPHE